MRKILYHVTFELGMVLFLVPLSLFAELQPLSESEANSIIAERYAKKAVAKSAKLERLNDVQVLSEAWVVDVKGRTKIYRDVILSEPVVSSVTKHEVSTGAPSADFAVYVCKPVETVSISATVYDHQATLLRWPYQGETYEAWCNVDFNSFRSITELETESVNYLFLFGIGDASAADVELPDLPDLSASGPVYALTDGESVPTEALAGLEVLLDYYATHEAELKVLHQRRKALAAANKRFLEKHPPEPETLIFNYYETDGGDQ